MKCTVTKAVHTCSKAGNLKWSYCSLSLKMFLIETVRKYFSQYVLTRSSAYQKTWAKHKQQGGCETGSPILTDSIIINKISNQDIIPHLSR